MFEQSIVAVPRDGARSAMFAVSLGAQVTLVGTLLLIPLFLIEAPSLVRLHAALTAPKAPPPPAMKLVAVPAKVLEQYLRPRAFYAPVRIPRTVAEISDAPVSEGAPAIEAAGPGVPGGQDVLGLSRVRETPPPPEPVRQVAPEAPKSNAPAAPIRVGGDVQAAKIVRRTLPVYPPLAKAARISGTVRLLGVISREGRIQQLQVLSGHPLLVTAALEAVRQWVYQPTLLNKEPVEVIAPIEVYFTLSQ